jgi:DHA1 family bicyclomycin/chloramphenicol resistance-like MFS transporter
MLSQVPNPPIFGGARLPKFRLSRAVDPPEPLKEASMPALIKQPSPREFVAMMAMLFATIALSIDAMLPALPAIAADLSPDQANNAQLVIGVFFAGMGLGTLMTGPISDAIGRKSALLGCAAIYLIGTVLCIVAPSLEMLLFARFLQGIGASGPRAAGVAMVRDMYKGSEMARIMSFVMMIFALVPAAAPLVGQAILYFGSWRLIFVAFMVFAIAVNVWVALRQPETLAPTDRRRLEVGLLWLAAKELAANRVAMISILCQTLSSASLVAALSSQQGIFEQRFGSVATFPLWFAFIALCSILGSILNSRIVRRVGMYGVVRSTYAAQFATSLVILLAITNLPLALNLEFALHILFSVSIFAAMGLTMGNLNAMALEPLGHIAGFAASVITAVSTVLSVLIAIPVGLAFNGTQVPVTLGAAVFSALAFGLMMSIKPARNG